jgi:hypothetical protein
MTGLRLAIGALVMGVLVPMALFFLLPLSSLSQLLTASATCFLSWGVADVGVGLLSRPRLSQRSPGSALREWENSRLDDTQE